MSHKLLVNSECTCISSTSQQSYGTKHLGEVKKCNSPDLLQTTIGNFGHWQCRLSILMSLLKFPIAWFQLGIVFLAPPTEFWCKAPAQYSYMTTEQWKSFIQPINEHTGHHYSTIETGSCVMRDVESDSENDVVPCLWGYDYNRTVIHSNIITEWDLVCNRERWVDVAQITLMFGVLIGSICFGVAADRFGRRNILLISILLQSFCGILSALSPWFSVFLLSRFLLAMANGGTMITSFVICMEIVGGKWRAIVPILYQIPFGIGNTIMAGIAFFVKDWRKLQFILSALSVLYISYLCLIPESPRWLLAVGRDQEAIKILEKAAKVNGIDMQVFDQNVKKYCATKSCVVKKRAGLYELVKTAQIRKRTLLLCLNWFICGINFFGFTQYLGQVSQNIYFAVAVGGLIAVPGTLLCVFVVQRCGRRISIAYASFFTATCFLFILLVPRGKFQQDWPRVGLAAFGVIGMSVSVPALYLFTGELYPTILRNAGVGSAVMCSKFGSMMAPLIIALGGLAWYLPLLILGILSATEAILVLPLPETLNTNLPETISDIENMNACKTKMENNDGDLASHLMSDKGTDSKCNCDECVCNCNSNN